MNPTISLGLADARLAATRDYLDAGAGNARIRFYSTPRPASGEAPGGAHLVEVVLAKPCGTISDGVMLLHQLAAAGDMIALDGAAVWARLVTGAAEFAVDGDVSDEAGSGLFRIAGTKGTLLYAGGSMILGSTALV